MTPGGREFCLGGTGKMRRCEIVYRETRMAIETRNVVGRREVRYASLDAMLADAERLAGGDVETLGNWTLGQILEHLALIQEASIDGYPSMMPAPVRWFVTTFLKRRFLTRGFPPSGPKMKRTLQPETLDEAAALQHLRRATERVRTETRRAKNPVFGEMTLEEWEQLYLRHAELHLSFVRPVQQAAEGSA